MKYVTNLLVETLVHRFVRIERGSGERGSAKRESLLSGKKNEEKIKKT
jgi:hypothetical protein